MRRPAVSCGGGRSSVARAPKVYHANDPASPTPAADADGVVAFFPDFGLVAYTPDGKDRWTLPLGPFTSFYGMAASPDPRRRPRRHAVRPAQRILHRRGRSQDRERALEAGPARRPPKGGRRRWCSGPRGNRRNWSCRAPTRLDALCARERGAAVVDADRVERSRWAPWCASGDMLFVSTSGSTEPSMPAFDSYLAKYDKDKDRRLSVQEFAADKEMARALRLGRRRCRQVHHCRGVEHHPEPRDRGVRRHRGSSGRRAGAA